MVVADLLSLQTLAQTLLDAVTLQASGSTMQPSQLLHSRSVRRRRRRQATLRKLYSASVVASSSMACEDSSAPVSSAHDCVVTSDVTSPIPTGLTLQTNLTEALTNDEVATILSDLPSVHLSTYDCSRSALCHRFKKRLGTD